MIKKSILVVEDEAIVARDIEDRLKKLGYTVIEIISSGEEAIQKAKELVPDLILMDIKLKGDINGVKAAEEIRKNYDIPIVYLTSYIDDDTFQSAKITEPFGYILKPFQERELKISIDIAIYKHEMEKRLKEKEKWLDLTLKSIGDAVIATDKNGDVISMNPVAETLTDLSQEDAAYKNLTDLITLITEDNQETIEIYNIISRLKEEKCIKISNNAVLVTRNGKKIPIDDTVTPICDEKGNRIGNVFVFRDVSNLRKFQKRLTTLNKTFLSLGSDYEKNIDMFVNSCGKLLNSTSTFYNKIKEDSLYTVASWNLPDDFKMDGTICRDAIKNSKEGCSFIVKDLDQSHYAEVNPSIKLYNLKTYIGYPVFSSGKIVGTLCNLYDTDTDFNDDDKRGLEIIAKAIGIEEDRKQGEDLLATEKEQLTVTLHSIGDGVITTDINGEIILFNRMAQNITGYTDKEAIGKKLNKILNINNEKTLKPCEDPVKKVIETGEIIDFLDHTILTDKDGTEKYIAISSAPIYDNDKKIIGVVLVLHDMTEKQRIEKEIAKIQKLESIGILAGGIAHDFNNILTSIIGNISLAKMELKREDKIFKILEEAEKVSISAKDLTQQLLTFSKGGNPVKTKTSIPDIIKDSAIFALTGSSVGYDFVIPDDLWSVEVDMAQINRVIHNLIINAEQSMPEGGIINITAENINIDNNTKLPLKAGKYVKISIKDHGVGIPKQYLIKIFDPYFSTKQKGSGLGLTVVYSIINKHDGYITVDSESGIGTTFNIYLPALDIKPEPTKLQVSDTVIPGQGRILVMDDEEVIRTVVGQMLKRIGYEVEFAENGNQAIDIYKNSLITNQNFDVVIIDLTIQGGMGGKETIEELLKINPNIKAIVSSGYSNDEVVSSFKKYGFVDVLPKPYRIKELSQKLYKVIYGQA